MTANMEEVIHLKENACNTIISQAKFNQYDIDSNKPRQGTFYAL
ncbi:MAG: hypothetical protein PVH88_07740 [Ignavibacteria bacterium]|jgi:hypothetical protein